MSRPFAIALTIAAVGLSAGQARAELPRRSLDPAAVVALAREHSPALELVLHAVERAQAALRIQERRYVPSFLGTAGYQHSEQPTLGGSGITLGVIDDVSVGATVAHTFPFGTAVSADLQMGVLWRDFAQPNLPIPISTGPGWDVLLTLSVTQPLLRGFGLDVGEADLRVARLAAEQQGLQEQRTASDVARQALVAFWELWYAERSIEVQRRSREIVAQQVADAEARIEAGQSAPFQALTLRVALASADEAVASAEIAAERARTELARAVGLPPEQATSLRVDAAFGPLAVPPSSAEQAAAEAREHAVELRELRAQIDQAQVAVDAALDAVQPRVDAKAWVASAGLGNRDFGAAWEMFGELGAVSGFVGLEVALPFDRTSLTEEVARAQAHVAVLEAQLREAELRVAAQAVDAVQAWGAADVARRAAEETERLATLVADGQAVRLREGAGTALELVVAEKDRVAAELRKNRAQIDAEQARLLTAHLAHALLSQYAQ